MNAEIQKLKLEIQVQRKIIQEQANEIRSYKHLKRRRSSQDEHEYPNFHAHGYGISYVQLASSSSDEDQAVDAEGPLVENCAPIWDALDSVHRCVHCSFEIVEGQCQYCGTCYSFEYPMSLDETMSSSIMATDDNVRPDRQIHPRGTTPLLSIDPVTYAPAYLPYGYTEAEYVALLERGAPRAMILAFDLEFNHESGIVAWADSHLFEQFTGPLMKKGDKWKIHLGRRVELDPDDLDGSIFIEELLEDILFTTRGPTPRWRLWKTKLTEKDGFRVWVTTPVHSPSADSDDEYSDDEYSFGELEAEGRSSVEDDSDPSSDPLQLLNRYESEENSNHSDESEEDPDYSDSIMGEQDANGVLLVSLPKESPEVTQPKESAHVILPPKKSVDRTLPDGSADVVLPEGSTDTTLPGGSEELALQGVGMDVTVPEKGGGAIVPEETGETIGKEVVRDDDTGASRVASERSPGSPSTTSSDDGDSDFSADQADFESGEEQAREEVGFLFSWVDRPRWNWYRP